MKPLQISQNLLHSTSSKTRELRDLLQTVLAGLVGALFGLLMGMTALTAFLGSQAAREAGEPGMLLIKVFIVGTFVILSVILFTWGFGSEDEDNTN